MKRILMLVSILFTSLLAQARVPSDTDMALALAAAQPAAMPVRYAMTCKLNGFAAKNGGAQAATLVDVQASSVEDAMRQSVSTQSESAVASNGDIRLLKIEMGGGQTMWAQSVACGDQIMQVADCCKAVCGTCKH